MKITSHKNQLKLSEGGCFTLSRALSSFFMSIFHEQMLSPMQLLIFCLIGDTKSDWFFIVKSYNVV